MSVKDLSQWVACGTAVLYTAWDVNLSGVGGAWRHVRRQGTSREASMAWLRQRLTNSNLFRYAAATSPRGELRMNGSFCGEFGVYGDLLTKSPSPGEAGRLSLISCLSTLRASVSGAARALAGGPRSRAGGDVPPYWLLGAGVAWGGARSMQCADSARTCWRRRTRNPMRTTITTAVAIHLKRFFPLLTSGALNTGSLFSNSVYPANTRCKYRFCQTRALRQLSKRRQRPCK